MVVFKRLARVLADTDDDETERQHGKDPAPTDDDTPVDLGPLNTPAASENVSQRLDGVRLRQEVSNVA